MRKLVVSLLGIFLFLSVVTPAGAQTLLLIQGYLGSAGSWRLTGVTAVLQRFGWWDAGHLTPGPGPGGVIPQGFPGRGDKRFYTIDLPTEAPLDAQAALIGRYVAFLKTRHPQSPIVLIGHSAGGVAARLFMVRVPQAGVRALITIASPHLGTVSADMAATISDSPLGWIAPFFGGLANTINRSRVLYDELGRERPFNLVGWLNRQPHPPAIYVSIVRTRDPVAPGVGDSFIRGWRQDMRHVVALGPRARTIFSPGDHGLRPDDGALLARILADLKLAPKGK